MAVLVCYQPATAQEINVNQANDMDMPAVTAEATVEDIEETHPILRISQDKSEMIKLEREAASVIVGNPAHISVLLDTPDTLVVVPRGAGASHFSVIGKDGSLIMQRHVIVGGPKEQYIRIRRSCAGNTAGCQATSVYFCPDMCHEVRENGDSSSSSGGFSFSF